jgi:hypothetical protein
VKWLPWISREHHESVVAAKNDLIRSLEAQNAVLAERLAEPVNVKVEFPKKLANSRPSESPAGREKSPKEPKTKKAAEIDYSTLNEKDAGQMAALALDEFGGKIPPPHILGRWYGQVRMQILYGKRKRQQNSDQTGSVGTIVVNPDDTSVSSLPAISSETLDAVPQSIRDLVAQAERGQ